MCLFTEETTQEGKHVIRRKLLDTTSIIPNSRFYRKNGLPGTVNTHVVNVDERRRKISVLGGMTRLFVLHQSLFWEA